MASEARLLTFGETMGVFSAGRPGRYGIERNFVLGIGGAEANVAIGAARLGTTAAWFGRVGSDATGDLIERLLRAEGINTTAIRDPGFTGLMVRHERYANASHVDYHRAGSAGSRLAPEDIPVDLLKASHVLHLTGITPALSESARAAVYESIEIASEAGVATSFDVNYRRKLWAPDQAAPLLRDLARRCTIVFAGREEADLLTGEKSMDAMAAARNLQGTAIAEVIVKDGAHGCAAVVDGVAYQVPAVPVRVIDPVGAGDAFVAGYLADRLQGQSVEARLHTAVRVGALAVSVPGDCENLPFRSDLATIGDVDVTR